MKIEITINISNKIRQFIRRTFTARNAVFALAAILFGIGMLSSRIRSLKRTTSREAISYQHPG